MLSLILPALTPLALAQDADDPIDAQRFRPAIDSEHFFAVPDTTIGPARTFGGMVMYNLARDPVELPDGQELDTIIAGINTVNAVGWVNLPRTRLGIDMPMHVYTTSEQYEGPGLLGDLGLEFATEIVERDRNGFGLAARVHGTLPTGNEDAWLGERTGTIGGGLVGSVSAGPALLSSNIGYASGTGATVRLDETWGDRIDYGFGLAYTVTPRVSVSGELVGEHIFDINAPPYVLSLIHI